ncbi:MAG: ATP-binding protein [Chloroflexia bacterium]|nr:ATP-binding protein [Chloroflexia bacterium]MDQ3513659.1 ATP-binding protein [Chloroflexota bacterium]
MATNLTEQGAAFAVAKEPQSVEQTGLDLGSIADLALKVIYFNNQVMGQSISDEICLPFFNIVDKALASLKREELIEVAGSQGFGEQAYQYTITPKGVVRVHQVLDRTTYVGPAPVTLEQYTIVIKNQAIADVRVSPTMVREAMADLVLDDLLIDSMGQAVNTGRSLFLFGPPGNGKTVLAEHIIPLLGGHVLIPHAFTVDGQIIKVLDLHNHQPVPIPAGRQTWDRRFVLCRRPALIAGGELTLDLLDLVYDASAKIYEAPLQVKANGGMFLIDDFGRQQVQPRQLLNRWIVPLEKRVDYMTLHTGKKIEIPFDQLIVFSTNLAPKDLVDEAFLRRIQNKVHIGNPTVETYREIFRRQCEALEIPFDQNGLVYLLREYYVKPKRELRSVHPRDILRILIGIARYMDISPRLTPDLLDRACHTYFVEL